MKYKLLIAFLLFLPTFMLSQVSGDSLSFVLTNYSQNRFNSYFDKQLNTYHFSNNFSYLYGQQSYNIGFKQKFNSAVIKSKNLNIRDDISLSLIGEYKYSPLLNFGILLNSDTFTDDRSLAINESAQNVLTAYSKYMPLEKLKIIPFAGVISNKQIGTTNSGYIYGGEALLDDFKSDIFTIYSSFKFQNEDIFPRRNLLRYFNVNVANDINNSFMNLLAGGFSEKRKDFYFEADSLTEFYFDVKNNIQSRTENNYFIQDNILFADPSSDFAFNLRGGINLRRIERVTRYKNEQTINTVNFDSDIEEFRYELEANIRYDTKFALMNLRTGISEREEDHNIKRPDEINDIIFEERRNQENRKNNKSRLLTVSLSGKVNLTTKDKINFSIFQRKLVYNTPSDDNFDDRDELLTIFRLRYDRKLTPFFSWFLNLEGTFNHLVYVFSERSGNNNKRRVLKLSSGGRYNTSKVSSLTEAEVSANYTTYDFEELNPNLKSFSFRQFTVRDSSFVRIARRTGILLEGYLKLSEQGDFFWNNFSSIPQRYIQELYVEPKIVVKYNNIKLSGGIRFFRLSTFKHISNTDKELDTRYSSFGPVSDIVVNMSSVRLKLYGWYEVINTEAGKELENVNLIVRLNWIL